MELECLPHSAGTIGLTRTEVRRRLCHMLPGMFALLLALVPQERPVPQIRLIELTILIALLGFVVRQAYPLIARQGEENWTLNIVRYSATIVALLFLFPWNPEFAAVVVTVIAFGDGAATLFGLQFGRRHLPWNSQKTWAGVTGFALCAFPLSTLAYWLEAQPAASLWKAAICAGAAVLCGEVAESLPLNSSDNLRVGLASGLGVVSTHQLMFLMGDF